MKKTTKLKAIIFDVDGTLAETEEVHREAFNQAFIEFNLPYSWSKQLYKQLLNTTGGKERMKIYLENYLNKTADINLIAKIHKRKTSIYGEMISQGILELRPGIADLINDAKKQGVRIAIATTTNKENVERLSKACFNKPAEEIFEVIAAGDEVENKKPFPDVFKLALKRLNLEPQDCVGLEDSRNGLLSCIGAGIACVVSPGIYTMDANFDESNAIVTSFVEIDSVSKLKNIIQT